MVYSIYIFFIIKGGISLIKIAIMGHGTVGSGVVEVLNTNHASITAKAAEEIQIKYILDLKEFPGLPYSDLFIKDFDLIVNDPEIDVVVEVMGGLNPAYDFVKRCLLAVFSQVNCQFHVSTLRCLCICVQGINPRCPLSCRPTHCISFLLRIHHGLHFPAADQYDPAIAELH